MSQQDFFTAAKERKEHPSLVWIRAVLFAVWKVFGVMDEITLILPSGKVLCVSRKELIK